MLVRFNCPNCGNKVEFDSTKYELELSWSDPHNPYSGEWIKCPECLHVYSVSDGVSVHLTVPDNEDALMICPDDAFVYIQTTDGKRRLFI